MKLFKKLLAVTLAGVLALSVLTACSGGSGSTVGASGKAVMQTMKNSAPAEYKDGDTNKITERNEQDTTLANHIKGRNNGEDFASRYNSKKASDQTVISYFMAEMRNDRTGDSYNAKSLIGTVVTPSKDSPYMMQAAIIKVEKKDVGNVSTQASALWAELQKTDSTVYKADNSGNLDKTQAMYLSVSDIFKVGNDYYRVAILTAKQTTT